MRISLFLGIFLGFSQLFGQNINLQTKGTLPNELEETSGVIVTPNGSIWSHNDSGNDPILYQISTAGNLLKSLYIAQAQNIDWEDLAKDAQGQVYIGDFGNNSNNAKIWLFIGLEIQIPSAEILRLQFQLRLVIPTSRLFPRLLQIGILIAKLSFGTMIPYLFSKNRTNPFNGYTRMYRIPADTGSHVATLVDSFFTGLGLKEQYWITAASLSPDSKRMVLLGYDKMWLFNCFAGSDFFGGGVRELSMGSLTQKRRLISSTKRNFTSPMRRCLLLGKSYTKRI